MKILTNACPICEKKTSGGAVREVLFCTAHREIAIQVRDDPALIKKYKKRFPKGNDFVILVSERVRK